MLVVCTLQTVGDKEYLMLPKMPKYTEKCDMRILLKYATMQQSAKYVAIAYSRFSDMTLVYIGNYHVVLHIKIVRFFQHNPPGVQHTFPISVPMFLCLQ